MRPRVLVAVGVAMLGGCLAQPGPEDHPAECDDTDDCNSAAGEICDDGVCWGDPPAGLFAAVLGVGSEYAGFAANTEIPELSIAADGWFSDRDGSPPALTTALRVSGQVRTECPPELDGCNNVLIVPGTIRWSRPSRIPGLPPVTIPAIISGPVGGGGPLAGFEVFLPRPIEPTTYSVSFTPSTEPLGPGQLSAAHFLPPFRTEVVVDPAYAPGFVRDFMLPPIATARVLRGRIEQPAAKSIAGWRVHAESGDGTVQGSFALASNIALTDGNGDFTLAVVNDPDIAVVDVVFEPPLDELPDVRLRDHVVSYPLPALLTMPQFADRLIAAPVEVRGTDGSGTVQRLSGASVVARLDQQIGNVFLQHQTHATTTDGVASIQVALGTGQPAFHYEIDVLPGPTSEMASVYGVDLDVGVTVPTPDLIVLPRGIPLVGTVYDELGFAVPGATVTASVSAATLCELSSEDLKVARGLAPVGTSTDPNGEFTLFVDRELDGVPLAYDITVEPGVSTWAPRWTFRQQAVSTDHQMLHLPAAAHVRATILDPVANPAPGVVVNMYEMTEEPAPCPQVVAFGEAGLAVRRAVATSDSDGVVKLILPRLLY